MSYYDYGFPRYVSVGEKKAKAAKKLAQLKKKNKDINPIILKGSKLTNTWWGKAWNKNLEAYADYSNRIGRGRSYVRHGAVLDLKIQAGKVTALVQGTESRPYSVEIDIKSIPKTKWNEIKKTCQGKLASVAKLLDGKFPKELQEIFTEKGSGLFPKPSEINFDCSCPDWASMCKHIAAALYGIGSRLDENPSLFFCTTVIEHALTGWIPRFIWPDKPGHPFHARGDLVNEDFSVDQYGNDASSFAGAAFADNGYQSLILYCFAGGFLLGLIRRAVTSKSKHHFLLILGYTFFTIRFGSNMEGAGLISIFYFMAFSAILVLIVFTFLMLRNMFRTVLTNSLHSRQTF